MLGVAALSATRWIRENSPEPGPNLAYALGVMPNLAAAFPAASCCMQHGTGDTQRTQFLLQGAQGPDPLGDMVDVLVVVMLMLAPRPASNSWNPSVAPDRRHHVCWTTDRCIADAQSRSV